MCKMAEMTKLEDQRVRVFETFECFHIKVKDSDPCFYPRFFGAFYKE